MKAAPGRIGSLSGQGTGAATNPVISGDKSHLLAGRKKENGNEAHGGKP